MGSSPGDSGFSHIMSFSLATYRSCQWIALNTCVHSGKEVADTLPATKISVSTVQGQEWAASGRGTLWCDHGSDVQARCSAWQGALRTWKSCIDVKTAVPVVINFAPSWRAPRRTSRLVPSHVGTWWRSEQNDPFLYRGMIALAESAPPQIWVAHSEAG